MLNSSLCSCILTDTCQANTPCANNGTCVLGSSPDNYTCDYTGTNFMHGSQLLMVRTSLFKTKERLIQLLIQYSPQFFLYITVHSVLNIYLLVHHLCQILIYQFSLYKCMSVPLTIFLCPNSPTLISYIYVSVTKWNQLLVNICVWTYANCKIYHVATFVRLKYTIFL